MKMQLPSIKPAIKDICKNMVKSSNFFVLKNTVIFHKNVIFINMQ